MKMMELTLKEREFLDDVSTVNRKFEKNSKQCLWNVVWGYLHEKFTMSLLNLSDEEIRKTLESVNGQAPRVIYCSEEKKAVPCGLKTLF